ncbi:MAG: DUF4404 family protein [Anaerolineae bacterium]|nr:DUF4404 family protein [Anaerolineae bacterium]
MPKKALEELRNEIDQTQVTDAAQRARIEDLKNRLDQSMEDSETQVMPLDELEQALILFGEDHPKLAAAIRAVIDILGEGGI